MTPTIASLTHQTRQQLNEQLRGTARGAGPISPIAATRIDEQIAGQVHGLLERDLISVLAEGWQSSRSLQRLATESRQHPQDVYTLELASQRISHVVRPSFDLYVDRRRLATVGLVITTTVLLPQLSAQVIAGALINATFAPGQIAIAISDHQGQQLLPVAQWPIGSSHQFSLPQSIPLPPEPAARSGYPPRAN